MSNATRSLIAYNISTHCVSFSQVLVVFYKNTPIRVGKLNQFGKNEKNLLNPLEI